MNMIEKVARGIATKHYEKRFHPSKIEQIKANVDANWNIFIEEAKAAIAAMREPTEEMIESCMLTGGEKYNGPSKRILKEMWQIQIEAALKE